MTAAGKRTFIRRRETIKMSGRRRRETIEMWW